MKAKNYIYLSPRLLGKFDKSITSIIPALVSRYGETTNKDIISNSRSFYESLIPQIPYIGEKDLFLFFMLPTVSFLVNKML